MKKRILVFLLLLVSASFYSQQLKIPENTKKNNQSLRDSTKLSSKSTSNKNIKNNDAKIDQYLIRDVNGNERFLDTTLSISKDYKFNYLRKDNFGLLPFANLGQTYNELSKDFTNSSMLPKFGARARHFNYLEIEDINYYKVPTPLTELFFKTAFQQGQLLDAFFTVNTSKQLNLSIAYKGLRSLGNYQHQITSTGNLRFTTNFHTKNDRYHAKAHITTQDLLNEENGGIKDEDIPNFLSGDEDFLDRSVFDPNFENAENILVGKRFYLNHDYKVLTSNDSLNKSLSVKHIIEFEDKYFQFDQTNSVETFFGNSFYDNNLRDKVTLENFNTKIAVQYDSPVIGDVSLGIGYTDINYGYDRVTILNQEIIPNRIQDQVVSIEGQYTRRFNNILLNAEFGSNLIGDFNGSHFSAMANYALNEELKLQSRLSLFSRAPNYNLLLNQSAYINYNWYNVERFSNQNTTNFQFELISKRYLDVHLDYSTIENYAFFGLNQDTGLVQPKQTNETISLIKLKIKKELKLGKFALNNTLLYQNVNDETKSINVPDFVIRNTFYYSNHFFKNKALFLQTGVTLNYFTDYSMDAYDPLLAEFYTQNTTKMDGFPRLDFFVNAKIRQTRIFLKAEHFNSSFTGYNYFSAPNNPYRDFTIRFGLVWNFFL
ncbi:putative porin [Psychroserpens sp. BH13MA-6]